MLSGLSDARKCIATANAMASMAAMMLAAPRLTPSRISASLTTRSVSGLRPRETVCTGDAMWPAIAATKLPPGAQAARDSAPRGSPSCFSTVFHKLASDLAAGEAGAISSIGKPAAAMRSIAEA